MGKGWIPDDQFYAMKAQQKGGGGGGGVWQPHFQKQGWGNSKGGGKGWGKNKKKTDPQKTVWVGGVPEGATYQELMELAKPGGAKWAEVFDHKGKGTGAIGFPTPEEAQNAVVMLNGAMLNGSSLVFDRWEKPQ